MKYGLVIVLFIVAACSNSAGDEETLSGVNIKRELEWIDFSGGFFKMGDDNAPSKAADEKPRHTVQILPFSILRTEVTVAQYRDCTMAKVCSPPGSGKFSNWSQPGRDQHPVNFVDWSQAQTYCQWVKARLPTEAEWEFAARNGGEDLSHPWGDSPTTCEEAVIKENNVYGCGKESTWPVCSKPRGNTKQDLCDMIGNVWEWTLDWYHPTYRDAPIEGPWVEPTSEARVIRGGGFIYDAYWNRSTVRNGHGYPEFRTYGIGFRCVKGNAYSSGKDKEPVIETYPEGKTAFDDLSALGKPCSNADGNTHADCPGDANYCVPDVVGVEAAGLTRLTCAVKECNPLNPDTCPPHFICRVVPKFARDYMKEKGILIPITLCGAAQ